MKTKSTKRFSVQMMGKVNRYAAMLLCVLMLGVGEMWGTEVTVGIVNPMVTTSGGASSDTLKTATHLTLTKELGKAGTSKLSDSLSLYTSGDKEMYKDATKTKYYSKVCYKWGKSRSSVSPNLYLGYKVRIEDGYKFSLSSLSALMAVGANFTYKVDIVSKTGSVLFTAGPKSITNYNNNTSTNAQIDSVLSSKANLQNLTDSFYVRAYMYISATAKYFCFPKLTITGTVEAAASCDDPTTTFADGAYVIGGSALDLSTLIGSNNSSGNITYSVKNANGTGATIGVDGYSLSATTAGTCTVTATQEAASGKCEAVLDATITVVSTKRIYMKAGAWNNDTPYFYAHSWGSLNSDVLMTAVGGCEASDVFYADIPSGNDNVLFTRQSTNSGIKYKDETGNYNQSANLDCSSNDKFTFSAWNVDGYSTFTGSTYSAPTYTITYNANGGTGSMSNETGIACDGSQTLTTNSYTRSGWTFTGWNTNKYGTGTAYSNGATINNISADITLYAQWEKEIYMVATGDLSWWYNDNAWFAVYYYDSGADSNNGWIKMTSYELCNTTYYKATIPGNGYDNVIFVRMNQSKEDLAWASKDNQTSNVAYPTSNALFTINGGSGQDCTGSWGTPSSTYTITFDGNGNTGGSMSNVINICSGSDETLASNSFTRTGWTFTGWNTNKYGTGTAYSNGATISGISANITLYAQWEKTIYLYSDQNDWNGASAWFAVYYFDSGDDSNNGWIKMTLADCETNVYTVTLPGNGYDKVVFARMNPASETMAWSNRWNQTGDVAYPTGDNDKFTVATVNGNNCTGSWSTYSAPTFTISYAAGTNGMGSKASESKTCGVDFTLPSSAVFTRTGYTQTGWATSDGGDQAFALGGSYTTDAAQTFYPYWSVRTYSVTYNGNSPTSGSVPTDDNSYDNGETVTVLGNTGNLAKTDYTFRGWTDGTTFYTAGNTFTISNDDVTLTAVWESNDVETINYYYGQVKIVADTLQKDLSSASITFFTNTSGVIASTTAISFSSDPAAGSIYYYSNDLGDASLSNSSNWSGTSSSGRYIRGLKFAQGTDYTLVLGKKIATSIKFYGWCGSASRTMTIGGQSFTSNSTKKTFETNNFTKSGGFTGNVTISQDGDFFGILVITCRAGSTHKYVAFENQTGFGGTTTLPDNIAGVPTGKKILQPSNPSATGYTFGGWYTDAACTSSFNWSGTITQDTIIYAKWAPINYTVTLNNQSATSAGSTSISVTYDAGTNLTGTPAITKPTKTGYVFGGYYTETGGSGTKIIDADGNVVASAADASYTYTDASKNWKYAGDITLYALWGREFSLVTSTSNLEDGTEIVITDSLSTKALSTTQNTNNRGATDITLVNSKIIVPDASAIQVITLESESSNFRFNVGTDSYLYAGSSSNNYLKTTTKASASDNGVWSISLGDDNKATITAQGTNTHNLLKYNSSKLFSAYIAGVSKTYLTKLYYCTSPYLRVTSDELSSFTYAEGYGPSMAQAITVRGFNLSGDLTVTVPSNYEVCLTASGSYSSSVILTKDGSNKVNTTFYVRLADGLSADSYDSNLAITGGGIAPEEISLTGLVDDEVPSGTAYKLVTNAVDLFPDDEIVIMNAAGTYIMGNNGSGNNRPGLTATDNFTITSTTVFVTGENVQNITLEKSDDEWLFKVGDNSYLYAGAKSNNHLKTGALNTANNGNGNWKAEIDGLSGSALVFAPNSTDRRDTMQFYSTLFSCYASNSYSAIKLYAKKPSATANVCGSPSALSGFAANCGSASAAQEISIKARNITSGDVTITAPTGYEVCLTEDGTYASSVTLTPVSNAVAPTTVYVRLAEDNSAGSVNGNISISATGATTRTIALTGTVTKMVFTNAGGNGLWSTTENWGGVLPTINDVAYIAAPVEVDVTNAVAKKVIIDLSSTNTVHLTIPAGKALTVATTVKKTTDGETLLATEAADITIGSDGTNGNAALVMGNYDGTNAASVNFYTLSHGVKNSDESVNQYIGTPFTDATILSDYYNSWMYKITYTDGEPGWTRITNGNEVLNPFQGYCVISADEAGHVYNMAGTLVATTNRSLSLVNNVVDAAVNEKNENLLANSWTAPIKIDSMKTTDFTNAIATIYIFNSGSPNDYKTNGGSTGDLAGQYSTYPIGSAEGAVIPSMQSFSVYSTNSSASVSLNYERIVYRPAVAETAAITPNKVRRQLPAVVNDETKLRIYVQAESGYADMVYMRERDDFAEGFENGYDGHKIFGESVAPQLYAVTPDGNMAVNCVPDLEGTVLGFKKGEMDENYTFTFEYDEAEALYLLDTQTGTYTDVDNDHSYTFLTDDVGSHNRFVLTRYRSPQITTGMEPTSDLQGSEKAVKLMDDNKLFILFRGVLYDATGKRVEERRAQQ